MDGSPIPVASVESPSPDHWIARPWKFLRRRPLLLPPGASAPLVLLWVWLLPQALLLALNLQAWDLASGEMNPANRSTAFLIFGLELALLLGGAAFLVERLLRRRAIPRLAGFGLVAMAAVYLGFAFVDGSKAIPSSLQAWMLQPEQWLYKQFALVGIGAIYGALRLLCPDREGNILVEALAVVAAFAAPFGMFLVLVGISASGLFFHGWNGEVASRFFIPLYLAASMLAIGAVLRTSVSGYVAARRWSPVVLVALTGLVALVLPLCGLALNSHIAFPVDFQIPVIYALAIVNGVVLALPNFSHPLAHRAVWLAQCALFPFTAYFFAVFLPFLPLMPLATIFMGLGLLMCVPSALFMLHGYRILDGAKAEMRDGPRWRPLVLGACAIAVGPALLTAKILHKRDALRDALDYLQYPDYAAGKPFPGSREALRSALLGLRDFKAGHYLPFYSEFYNWLAFDNLVLPQSKLDETWRAFFGEPMPAANARKMNAPFFSRERPRTMQEVLTGVEGTRPPANATLESLQTTVTSSPGEVRALARIATRNPTGDATEFRATLRVPDGVAITGMWLTIDSERVPARLFEERAALWVYQKITEVRPVPRDPAILRYIGPGLAELRVFPVPPRGERFVEIEFRYPDNLSPRSP